jgi:minor extracellular serine protease Vpr
VISSINSFTTDDYTSVASREMNGRTYHFAAFSGTSMASPAAAGVVALLLEANPLLSSAQVKQILRNTARQDNRTGVINEPGSPLWGMGRITATKAVALALQTTGSNEIGNPITLTLFPNPAYDKLYLGEENQILKGKISIFNLSGQVCYEGIYSHLEGIAIQDLGEGLYVLQLENEHSIYRAKFVKAD